MVELKIIKRYIAIFTYVVSSGLRKIHLFMVLCCVTKTFSKILVFSFIFFSLIGFLEHPSPPSHRRALYRLEGCTRTRNSWGRPKLLERRRNSSHRCLSQNTHRSHCHRVNPWGTTATRHCRPPLFRILLLWEDTSLIPRNRLLILKS